MAILQNAAYAAVIHFTVERPTMLAEQCGRLICEARKQKGLKQEQLARQANVSRTVVSLVERGKLATVKADTLDRLLAALELKPVIGKSSRDGARRLARLEQELSVRRRRERHLRLAIELADDEKAAAAKVDRAKRKVALWQRNRVCSPFYIERWSQLLAQPPRRLARDMASLGEWEDAMFQNSPWAWPGSE